VAATAFVFDESVAPRLAEVRSLLVTRFPLFKELVDRAGATFGDEWVHECEETLERVFPTVDALTAAVEGYAAFALDIMRRQQRFEKQRAYPAKTYAEAEEGVYFNDEYMVREYLPGLLLSHYFWPHHYHQARYFDSAFVSQMRVAGATVFAEVGTGTALYSRRVLQQLPDTTGVGFDISPSSKAFADAQMSAFGFDDRYLVQLRDVVADPIGPFEWLICVEVLEHLEDPAKFLRALREALTPGGHAFITAALNAPHVDHIYLYEKPEEVIQQLTSAGFALEQAFIGAAFKPRLPDLPVPTVAAFIVV
jgi:SAM-dependent methyltransferase